MKDNDELATSRHVRRNSTRPESPPQVLVEGRKEPKVGTVDAKIHGRVQKKYPQRLPIISPKKPRSPLKVNNDDLKVNNDDLKVNNDDNAAPEVGVGSNSGQNRLPHSNDRTLSTSKTNNDDNAAPEVGVGSNSGQNRHHRSNDRTLSTSKINNDANAAPEVGVGSNSGQNRHHRSNDRTLPTSMTNNAAMHDRVLEMATTTSRASLRTQSSGQENAEAFETTGQPPCDQGMRSMMDPPENKEGGKPEEEIHHPWDGVEEVGRDEVCDQWFEKEDVGGDGSCDHGKEEEEKGGQEEQDYDQWDMPEDCSQDSVESCDETLDTVQTAEQETREQDFAERKVHLENLREQLSGSGNVLFATNNSTAQGSDLRHAIQNPMMHCGSTDGCSDGCSATSLSQDEEKAKAQQGELSLLETNYKTKVAEMNQVLQETQGQVDSLAGERDQALQEAAMRRKESLESQEQVGKLQEELGAAQKQLVDAGQEQEMMRQLWRNERATLEEKVTSYEEALCESKAREEKLSLLETNYKIHVAEMNQALQETQGQVDSLAGERDQALQEAATRRKESLESQEQVEKIQEELGAVQKQLVDAGQEQEAMRELWRSERATLEKKLTSHEEALCESKAQEEKLILLETNYKTEVAELNLVLQETQGQVDSLAEERDQALQALQEVATRGKESLESQEQAEKLEEELGAAQKQLVDAGQEQEVMRQLWRSERAAWEQKVTSYEEELCESKESAVKLQRKLKARDEALERLQKKLSTARTELMDCNKELEQGIVLYNKQQQQFGFNEMERREQESHDSMVRISRGELSQQQLCSMEFKLSAVQDERSRKQDNEGGIVVHEKRSEKRMEYKRHITTFAENGEEDRRMDNILEKLSQATNQYSEQLAQKDKAFARELRAQRDYYEGLLLQTRMQNEKHDEISVHTTVCETSLGSESEEGHHGDEIVDRQASFHVKFLNGDLNDFAEHVTRTKEMVIASPLRSSGLLLLVIFAVAFEGCSKAAELLKYCLVSSLTPARKEKKTLSESASTSGLYDDDKET